MKCKECEDQKREFHIHFNLSDLKKYKSEELKAMREKCINQNKYFTLECETHIQLKPEKLSPKTRYECIYKHSWFI